MQPMINMGSWKDTHWPDCWTAVTKAAAEQKAKEDAEAAASGGPRRGAPKKAAADTDEKKRDPRELEIEKVDKLLEQAHKNQITEKD